MTPFDFLAGLWRTVVPLVVGTLVAWLAHAGLNVDSAAATAWLTTAFSSVYYALFHFAETHLGKGWGWFLGLARPPVYPGKDGAYAITSVPAPPPAQGV